MSMHDILKSTHSYWAFAALILLTIAFITSLVGWLGKKDFSKTNYKWALYGFIAAHIQLLLGLLLLFTSHYWSLLTSDMGSVMKDPAARLMAVEHPVSNILAIILITLGWRRHKSQLSSEGKFKTVAIFYGLGLLLLLGRIPWGQWLG